MSPSFKLNLHICHKLRLARLSLVTTFFLSLTMSVLAIGIFSSCKKADKSSSKDASVSDLSSKNTSTNNDIVEMSASNLPVGAIAILITDYTSLGSQKFLSSPNYASQTKALSLALAAESSSKKAEESDKGNESDKSKNSALSDAILKTGILESPFVIGRSDKFPTIKRKVWYAIAKEKGSKDSSTTPNSAASNLPEKDKYPDIGVVVYGLSEDKNNGINFIQNLITQFKARELADNGVTVTSLSDGLPDKVVGATISLPAEILLKNLPTTTEWQSQDSESEQSSAKKSEKTKESKEKYIPITFLSNGSVLVAGTSLKASLLPFSSKTVVTDGSNFPLIANNQAYTDLKSLEDAQTSSTYGVVLIEPLISSATQFKTTTDSKNTKFSVATSPADTTQALSHLTFVRSYADSLTDQVELKFSKSQPLLAIDTQDRPSEKLLEGGIIGVSFGKTIVSKIAPLLSIAVLTGQIPLNNELVALAKELESLTLSLHTAKQDQAGLIPSVIISANVAKPAEAHKLLEKGIVASLKQGGLPLAASPFEDIKVGDISARSLQTPFGLTVLSANNDKAIVLSTSAESLALGFSNQRDTSQTKSEKESLPAHLAYKINFPELLSTLESLQGGLSMLTGGEEEGIFSKDRLNQLKSLKSIGSLEGFISSSDSSIRVTQLYSTSTTTP